MILLSENKQTNKKPQVNEEEELLSGTFSSLDIKPWQ